MALRAVVFDYGMVLTGPPDPAAYAALQRISGLSAERLDRFYWADRHAYDEGKLTGLTFWQKIMSDAGLSLDEAAIAELNGWDARMWTTQNPAMVAWQADLKERGLLTAILSNMGDSVHESIERAYEWIGGFDVRVWSYQLKVAKPDAAIYEYALAMLGTRPEETLFLDDKPVNIEAAHALGMKGLVFSDVERLRADLIAAGMDAELPLPG
ncbi:MAG TPA: HAD family phosphatase [Terracidiphilus sp.]|nr:HAD family phosphatase [Terracidiphilus sp.]